MNLKNWVQIISDSVKDSELNRILDKISLGEELSKKESLFLARYSKISDDDLLDLSHLSIHNVYDKITYLLKNDKKVICDLTDKYGKIGLQILSVTNFTGDDLTLNFKNGENFKIKDNFLYKILYSINKDEYSLQSQGEYFEKLYVVNEN